MTARQKKSVVFFGSGIISIGLGVVFAATSTTPPIVNTILTILGVVGNVLGYTFVYPDQNT